jgi:hypothetical protein
MIVSSAFTEGTVQQDGRRSVREVYTDDLGQLYVYEWLGDEDITQVMTARTDVLNAAIARKRAADVVAANTLLPITRTEFRLLFTLEERYLIDEFNAQFDSNPALSTNQKRAIRTGLQDLQMANLIPRPFSSRVVAMLDLYLALGFLTSQRRSEILAAGSTDG